MNDDMTYSEICEIKSHIQEFLDAIQSISKDLKNDIYQFDIDFFAFIAKHIIFLKYIDTKEKNTHFYKVLISDLYYLILSIIRNETRYMYVNERSIIENYLRAIMQVTLQDNHVTNKVFDELHEKNFKCCFSRDEYALIKSEYTTSCGYIHGGDILNSNLVYVLEECANKKFDFSERKNYYIRFQKMLKIFDRLIIAENSEYINGCFHRKKSVMEYLVGKEQVDLLFKILNEDT